MRPHDTTNAGIGWLRAPLSAVLGAAVWLAAPALAEPALSADASAWDGDERGAVRLIAGARLDPSGSMLRAGVEVRLGPGWKTYWRYPGDAGVPPRFDFAGSRNLAAVEIGWPAPRRLDEGGIVSIGYEDDVVFPLRVTARDANAPVELRLRLDYAVCEKLCLPAQASAALVLSGQGPAHDAEIADAEARVPKKAALGERGPLAVATVQRTLKAGKPQIVVDVAAAPGSEVALFAEGPTPDWALPVPAPVDGAPPGLRRFVFELDGAPSGAETGRISLKLTAVAGERAIEVVAPLD